MRLRQIIAGLNPIRVIGDLDIEISGVHYDSRLVAPGFLFVAVAGFKVDGHSFIPNAVTRGCRAVVAERETQRIDGVTQVIVANSREALASTAAAFYEYPSDKLKVFGVTGTNGKTTTTHLIQAILAKSGQKVGLLGTVQNRIGDQVYPVVHTTPEALDLQEFLAKMVQAGCDSAVMEVSSHALDLERVKGCEFDTAVFTNLTQDHLDFHQNIENYFNAKSKLFKELKPNRKFHKKYAIINIDDPWGKKLVDISEGSVVTYGIREKADVKAEDIQITPKGCNYTLVTKEFRLAIKLKLTGLFNVYNSLAAIVAGITQQIPLPVVTQALAEVAGVPGRFELVNCGQDFSIVVDYAHTPDSLENILKTAREFVSGRIITVFGCGGDRDRTKRPLMGEVAGRYSHYTVLTSDNPRSEEPEQILAEIEAGISRVVDRKSYEIVVNRREAIARAIDMAMPGDMVVIAGKGHETYQIIKGQTFPFDDREVAAEAVRQKIYHQNF